MVGFECFDRLAEIVSDNFQVFQKHFLRCYLPLLQVALRGVVVLLSVRRTSRIGGSRTAVDRVLEDGRKGGLGMKDISNLIYWVTASTNESCTFVTVTTEARSSLARTGRAGCVIVQRDALDVEDAVLGWRADSPAWITVGPVVEDPRPTHGRNIRGLVLALPNTINVESCVCRRPVNSVFVPAISRTRCRDDILMSRLIARC